jgi:hypothetical protein
MARAIGYRRLSNVLQEKPAGTVASHAWPFLLRRIWLEALIYRRRMPE